MESASRCIAMPRKRCALQMCAADNTFIPHPSACHQRAAFVAVLPISSDTLRIDFVEYGIATATAVCGRKLVHDAFLHGTFCRRSAPPDNAHPGQACGMRSHSSEQGYQPTR